MMNISKLADSLIDELIGRVVEAYPEKRLAAIRERTEAVWAGRHLKDRITYVYSGNPDFKSIPADSSPFQRDLLMRLLMILHNAAWDNDYYPGLNPGNAPNILTSYFGCEAEIINSQSFHVRPIIHQAADVYQLDEPGFTPGTAGWNMLEKMRYFRERTGGRIPIYMSDVQGPFSMASQAWGVENFFLALHDFPKEAHHLLGICTKAVITYIESMVRIVGDDLIKMHCLPLLWFPKEKGAAVSEDEAAVVSPAIFRDFIRPYLEQIATWFGGVVMHSCGSLNHVIHELNQVKGMVGINFNSCETDFEKAAEEINPEYVIITHNGPVHRTDLPLLNQVQHVELCRKVFGKGRVTGICVVYPWYAAPVVSRDAEIYRQAATYGKKLQ